MLVTGIDECLQAGRGRRHFSLVQPWGNTMQIFELRDQPVHDYTTCTANFIPLSYEEFRERIEQSMPANVLCSATDAF